ncbi:hypothetical protein A8A06_07425 [Escherichia coli]|nr:hypothetical protein A8A06_07425 [Escherichia coli]
MIPYEQALGNGGKEKLPFNRKKPPAEPGSGRGSHLPRQVGGEGTEKTERRAERGTRYGREKTTFNDMQQ